MRREPKLWVPEPPWWLISITFGIVSAWFVVQGIIWVGDVLLGWVP
jgi:hypothetical protein